MAAPASSRFTAWLSDEERELVRELARELGSSENFVVRMAVRKLVGLAVPSWTDAPELRERELA